MSIDGIDHAGLSVADLDRSIAFYANVMGFEVIRKQDFGSEALNRIMALEGARGRSATLRAGSDYLEIFEFAQPTPLPNEPPRRVCDRGITHFCLRVQDVRGEHERLSKLGVEFHCEPMVFGKLTATYARDPDGNIVELLERGE